MVDPIEPLTLQSLCLASNTSITIADFGESFILPPGTESVPKVLGTPVGIAAPEILLGGQNPSVALSADIWSLACTLYELFSNHHLIESPSADQDEVLEDMVRALGKLPDRWWEKWEHRDKVFEDNGSFKQDSQWCMGEKRTVDLRERIQNMVVKPALQEEGAPRKYGPAEYVSVKVLADDEMDALEVLMTAMMKYEPVERIAAEKVLEILPAQWKAQGKQEYGN